MGKIAGGIGKGVAERDLTLQGFQLPAGIDAADKNLRGGGDQLETEGPDVAGVDVGHQDLKCIGHGVGVHAREDSS